MTLITGEVAKIIDSFTVVINKGYLNGVKEDMKFVIYQPGEEIFDPKTKESLGHYEKVKIKVKVTNVAEKHATAGTYEYDTREHPILNFRTTLFGTTVRKTLDGKFVDEYNYSPRALETIVKPSDLVRQIPE